MARLPTPGSDANVWGDVLNTFLTVEHNADGTLKIRTDGSVVQKDTLVFNVKDFGASGDGVADDTSEITAAIAAATTSGGGTIFFPPGVYMTTGIAVNSASDFTFLGSGPASTLKLVGGGTANVVQLNSCVNFSIVDLTFDCNRANTILGTDEDLQCGVHLVSCTAFLLRGLRLLDSHMSGIRLGLFPHGTGGCTDGAITNCYVNLGIDADQGIGVWNSQRISVTNCVVQRCGWGGIVLTRSDYCTVSGNTSYDNTYTIAGGGGHGVALEGARWSTVTGNVCHGNEYYGIHLEVDPQTGARYVEGCIVAGNACYGNDRGIFLGKAHSNTLTGNTVNNNTLTGIEVTTDASHSVLEANVCEHNGGQGIWVKGNDCAVSNNTVNNNSSEGILAQGATRVSIEGNHVFSNASAGVDLRGVDKFVVSNNIVEANAQGIFARNEAAVPCTNGTIGNNTSSANNNEGLMMESTESTAIVGNTVSGNINGGMGLRGVQYCTITGNTVLNNGTASVHNYGIQLNDHSGKVCLANTFSGNNSSDNQATQSQSRGIEELGGADRNIYIGNICRNNTDGQISTVGPNSITANNITA